jgi:hypothetical protein
VRVRIDWEERNQLAAGVGMNALMLDNQMKDNSTRVQQDSKVEL